MSEHATSVAVAPAPPGAALLAQNHFLLRRLHSLTGIVPIGAFLMFHLFTNMQMLLGTFQHEVNWIHSQPALLFMEVFVLWLPIGFHAALGIWYTVGSRPNVTQYHYAANWRYTLQRVTGIVALVFIFLHVAILRWRWNLLGWDTPFFAKGVTGDEVVVDLAHYSTAVALAHPLVLLFYVVGVMSAVFHWSNGLWTAAISWGATISRPAQRRWGYVCLVVFLSLAGFAAASVIGAVGYKDKAPAEQVQAYEHTRRLYREGKLDVHSLEKLAMTATGSRFESGH